MTEPRHGAVLGALWRMAQPLRRQWVLIVVLTLLGTAADLLNPLIYRVAVNDIAGLFVQGGGIAEHPAPAPPAPAATPPAPATTPPASAAAPGAPAASPAAPAAASAAPTASPALSSVASATPTEPHRRGHVSPRSTEQALRTLLRAVALWFLLNLVSHFFHLLADHRTTILSSRIEQHVIVDTFSHVLRLPLAFFSKRSSGGLTKQIDQLDQVAPIVTALSHQLLPELIRMVGIIAIMLTESWRLTLMALVTLPPYIAVVFLSARRLERGLDGYYETWERITARIQDALGAIKTVKLSGAERRESERLRREATGAFDQYIQRNRRANQFQLWESGLTYASQAIALAYGGYLVLERQLTPGDVVMFVTYLDKLYSPIEEISGLAVNLQEHIASLQRALTLRATPGGEKAGTPLSDGPGRVEFQAVRFGYTPEREVLQDVSFTLAPGKVTGLVGPSGAGKTTLVDLLLKLYEPTHGRILLDGTPLAAADPAAVRASIGMVAADGAIFRGTIADNLRYKRPEASDAEVLEAADRAGLSGTLRRLTDGLQSEIGERGFGLSVGERQRVQIARALLGRPRVLVLDEATANLDFATEHDVRGALLDGPDRPTTLVIAHRYSMVKDADWVIVLEHGRIVDQGAPAALAAKDGWFARFARAADDEGRTGGDAAGDADESGDTADEGEDDEDDESGEN